MYFWEISIIANLQHRYQYESRCTLVSPTDKSFLITRAIGYELYAFAYFFDAQYKIMDTAKNFLDLFIVQIRNLI